MSAFLMTALRSILVERARRACGGCV